MNWLPVRRRWLVIGGAVTVILLGVGIWIGVTMTGDDQRPDPIDLLASANAFIAAGDHAAAAAIVRQPTDHRDHQPDAWWQVDLTTATALADVPRLDFIARHRPDLITPTSRAASLLARGHLTAGDPAVAAQRIAAGRAAAPNDPEWYALAIDHAFHTDDDDALRALKPSPDAPDQRRIWHIRQALQCADRASAEAELLAAAEIDPSSGEAVALLAGLYEAAGHPEHALKALVTAVRREPNQVLWWDRLGSFQLRQGRPDQAIQAWQQGARAGGPGLLNLRAAFWSRMVLGEPVAMATPRSDPLAGLAGVINTMPVDGWDIAAWQASPAYHPQLERRAELVWITVIEAIARHDASAALRHCEANRKALLALDPVAGDALVRILRWQVHGVWAPVDPIGTPQRRHHTWFHHLTEAAIDGVPPAGADHPDAASLVLLAAGWRAVGDRLLAAPQAALPAWASYALARNQIWRGDRSAALTHLAAQPNDATCQLLAAEISLHDETQRDAATRNLTSLSMRPDAIGERARWLLTALQRGIPTDRSVAASLTTESDTAAILTEESLQ